MTVGFSYVSAIDKAKEAIVASKTVDVNAAPGNEVIGSAGTHVDQLIKAVSTVSLFGLTAILKYCCNEVQLFPLAGKLLAVDRLTLT